MPNSSPLGKDYIKEWFDKQTDIKIILDAGAGCGTYRNLLGNKYYWKGVEIWGPNIEKYKLEKQYDEIICKDIREVDLISADCVILGDVLEHLPYYEGLNLLEKYNKFYKHIVLSIPVGLYEQGPIDGNPYEEHLATWNTEDILAVFKPNEYKIFPYYNGCPSNLGIGVFIK
jgi:SAM-dependent methyltransferase